MRSQGHIVGTVTVLWAGWSRVGFLAGTMVFLSSKMSRLDLGPTQPPVGCVPGFLFPGAHWSCWRMKLHIVLRLVMTGALPQLCLCAFVAWSGTTLTLPVSLLVANSIKFVLSKFYVSLYAVNHLFNMSQASLMLLWCLLLLGRYIIILVLSVKKFELKIDGGACRVMSNNYLYNLLDEWMIRHVIHNYIWTVFDCVVCTVFWLWLQDTTRHWKKFMTKEHVHKTHFYCTDWDLNVTIFIDIFIDQKLKMNKLKVKYCCNTSVTYLLVLQKHL